MIKPFAYLVESSYTSNQRLGVVQTLSECVQLAQSFNLPPEKIRIYAYFKDQGEILVPVGYYADEKDFNNVSEDSDSYGSIFNFIKEVKTKSAITVESNYTWKKDLKEFILD